MGSVTAFLQGRQSHVDELSNGILRILVVPEGFTWSNINSLFMRASKLRLHGSAPLLLGLGTLSFARDGSLTIRQDTVHGPNKGTASTTT